MQWFWSSPKKSISRNTRLLTLSHTLTLLRSRKNCFCRSKFRLMQSRPPSKSLNCGGNQTNAVFFEPAFSTGPPAPSQGNIRVLQNPQTAWTSSRVSHSWSYHKIGQDGQSHPRRVDPRSSAAWQQSSLVRVTILPFRVLNLNEP